MDKSWNDNVIIPYHDPLFQPGKIIWDVGYTAFFGAVTIGNIPLGFTAALAMETLGTSRAYGVQRQEPDIADVAEC